MAYVEGQVLLQPGYGQNVRDWQKKLMYGTAPELLPSAPLADRPISPCPALLTNTSLEKLGDYEADRLTNEEFAKLLSEPPRVHFANDLHTSGSDLRLSRTVTSPVPGLVRHKFESNPSLDAVGHAQSAQRGFLGKHILSVDMFNKEQLNDIFNLAESYRYVLTVIHFYLVELDLAS